MMAQCIECNNREGIKGVFATGLICAECWQEFLEAIEPVTLEEEEQYETEYQSSADELSEEELDAAVKRIQARLKPFVEQARAELKEEESTRRKVKGRGYGIRQAFLSALRHKYFQCI